MAVQFYLHFQFNGWFLFAILALFFKVSEGQNIKFPKQKFSIFYWLLIISSLLTNALAIVWSTKLTSVLLVNSLGVILQLLALVFFLQLIWPKRGEHQLLFKRIERKLLGIAFFTFATKIIVQALVAIPFVAEAAYTIRNYVIGFIHLILLGAVTFFILAFALREGLLSLKTSTARLGVGTIALGFILSEALLFLQGTLLWGGIGFIPFYYEALFGVSVLLPIGILIFSIGQNTSTSLR